MFLSKVKKCKFCGGTGKIVKVEHKYYIYCKNCFLSTEVYKNKVEAIKAWNKSNVTIWSKRND